MTGADGPKASTGPGRRTCLILVVDDEAAVRTVTEAFLTRFGFDVLLAYDGSNAVDLLARHVGEVRAAVVDMTMPNMNGEDTCRALLRLRPDLPVIMTSGTTEEDDPDWLKGIGATGFLQKPYPPLRLVECLHELLET